ncbi:MAG TPA: type II 3-dehydroquinate dehydratase [Casimicrobiaceae bacterium]|nr:type II 3-dehydroquinate dehydratase [Casimicrobiaceae bacterium]
MNQPIHVLNGPNLDRLGTREPAIYGTATLADVEAACRAEAGAIGIVFRQSNSEGQLVDWIHEAIGTARGIVFNPAGYSFTSIAILDALKMYDGPIVEVHLSNIHRREAIYQRSLVSTVAAGVIAGLGVLGYRLAIRAIMERAQDVPPARP